MSAAAFNAAWEVQLAPSRRLAEIKLTLLYLAGCATEAAQCWPSLGQITRETGLTRHDVEHALDELSRYGLISIGPRRIDGPALITLTLPGLATQSDHHG